MAKILIKNIKKLYQIEETPRPFVAGTDMDKVNFIEDAYLAIEDDEIVDFGPMKELAGITDWNDLTIADAEGRIVIPAFCDSHTHLVYAASREEEFVDRIRGLSYEEIALKGGGILNSARRLANTPEEELVASALYRLDEVMQQGTGAIEIKSGYGLSLDAELKMLRVIKQLKELRNIPIKATFLGAHAFPKDYKENHKGYLDLLINEMLPKVAEEGLAEYVDAFLERNYFSKEETEQLIVAAEKYGLKPKIHVNQFSIQNGIPMAVEHNAVSVDHLEVIDPKDIEALKGSSTMPTMLPSCSFFINIPFGPARELIDAGLPLALASDYNPGTTPTGNMKLVMSLACIKQRLTPYEALNATTINGARAMELEKTNGSIAVGKKASIIISKPMHSLDFMPYAFGSDTIDSVIVNGEIVRSGKAFI